MQREREMRFERHMSDSEALMWNVEKDPALSSWFASITVLDTMPDFERFRRRMAVAVSEIPRLRQRVVARVGRLAPPAWVFDPEFDLDYHIRRMAVPDPGDDEALHELAVKLLLDPFDRTRPLWQMIIIEGMADGKAAMFQKMHHTITDGEGGVRLAEKFVDLEREVDHEDPVIEVSTMRVGDDFVASAQEALTHNARRFGGVAQRAAKSVVTNPLGSATGVGKVLAEVGREVIPSQDKTDAGSTLWTERSLRRWFGTITVDLDDVKRAAKARGGTVNDLFVAGALAGAARYHQTRDALPTRFRAAMPVSTRTGGSAGGNAFAISTVEMAAPHDVEEAFANVQAGLERTKSGDSVDIMGSLAMFVNLLPTSVLTTFAKDAARHIDFTVSNVRGAPIELYIAGAKVESLFPMGPIAGTGFNLTTMSYNGRLDMGLVVDTAAVEDPDALRADLESAYTDLLA